MANADEAPAFCHACGQPLAQAQAYLLTDAVADHRLEWGDARTSAESIIDRLNHVLDFIGAEEAKGEGSRFGLTTTCAAACTTVFVNAFRGWSWQQPVTWRNEEGEVTRSRPRLPSSTEAAIAQLIAVLNHVVNADPPRSNKRPTYKPLPPNQVQRARRTRIGSRSWPASPLTRPSRTSAGARSTLPGRLDLHDRPAGSGGRYQRRTRAGAVVPRIADDRP